MPSSLLWIFLQADHSFFSYAGQASQGHKKLLLIGCHAHMLDCRLLRITGQNSLCRIGKKPVFETPQGQKNPIFLCRGEGSTTPDRTPFSRPESSRSVRAS